MKLRKYKTTAYVNGVTLLTNILDCTAKARRAVPTSRCLCGLPTRLIVDRSVDSKFYKVPQETCGHKHGFVIMFPSYYAPDGLCERCYRER